jgi:aldehyde dehydrogenase (NAD+)
MAGSTAPAFVQGCLPNASVPLNCSEIKRFPMVNRMQFYIDGAWVDPAVKKSTPVVNPATEEAMY